MTINDISHSVIDLFYIFNEDLYLFPNIYNIHNTLLPPYPR